MANALSVRIEEVLRPIIGSVLATVSIDLETKRIGKTSDTVEYRDLPQIAENLGSALRLVVGADLANAAERHVRELV